MRAGRAYAGFFLNLLVLPGLGSILAKEGVGWIQAFLSLLLLVLFMGIGAVTSFGTGALLLLAPFAFAVWVWGLLTSVRVLREDAAQRGAHR